MFIKYRNKSDWKENATSIQKPNKIIITNSAKASKFFIILELYKLKLNYHKKFPPNIILIKVW